MDDVSRTGIKTVMLVSFKTIRSKRKSAVEAKRASLADAQYWLCYLFVPLMLIASAISEKDVYIAEHSPHSFGNITNIQYIRGKSAYSDLTVEFPRIGNGFPDCKVDEVVSGWKVHIGTTEIVRVDDKCGSPLLVEHLPSPAATLMVAGTYTIVGIFLFFYRRYRDEKRKMEQHWSD